MKNIVLIFLTGFLSYGQAEIRFDGYSEKKFGTLIYNLEPVKVGETTRLKIHFTNIGNEPLVITKYEASSSNTTISVSKEPVFLNQSNYLEAKILNNLVGYFQYSFVIGINNQEDVTVVRVNIKVIDDSKNERIVTGNVILQNDRLPLPGVSVIIKNTQKGTQTDLDGNYSLVATPNDTLVFSSAGMKEQKIKADKEVINVQMQEGEIISHTDFGPPIPPIPRPKPVPTKSIRIVTAKDIRKDIRNADNPKYYFRKNAKNNIFLVFVSELTAYDLNQEELEFQNKYKVIYSITGNHNVEYLEKHNKLTFKHLNKKFKNSWQTEIRKDAIGLDEFTGK